MYKKEGVVLCKSIFIILPLLHKGKLTSPKNCNYKNFGTKNIPKPTMGKGIKRKTQPSIAGYGAEGKLKFLWLSEVSNNPFSSGN